MRGAALIKSIYLKAIFFVHKKMADNTTYDMRPGVGLGPFTLNDTLNDTIAFVRREKLPDAQIQRGEDPSANIVLLLPSLGLKLFFLADTQLLFMIDLFAIAVPVTYTSKATHVVSPTRQAALADVIGLLGPTVPGTVVRGMYQHRYPGVEFQFDVSEAGSAFDDPARALPLTLPNGGPIMLRSLQIVTPTDAVARALPQLNITITDDGHVSATIDGKDIAIGDPAQRAVEALGPPTAVDRRRHNPLHLAGPAPPSVSDMVLTYTELGLDVVVAGGVVRKLVHHRNDVTSPSLGQYDAVAGHLNVSGISIALDGPWESITAAMEGVSGPGSDTVVIPDGPENLRLVGWPHAAFVVLPNDRLLCVTVVG